MWTKRALPALLLVLTAAPLPVLAQDAAITADIRCVAVGIRAAALPDSHQKSSGLLMALYYIGRLDGRDPKLDIEALMSEQLAKMTAADFVAETQRCGGGLTGKGAQITRIGQDLQKQLAGR